MKFFVICIKGLDINGLDIYEKFGKKFSKGIAPSITLPPPRGIGGRGDTVGGCYNTTPLCYYNTYPLLIKSK